MVLRGLNNMIAFLSHPYTGNEEENIKHSIALAKEIQERFPRLTIVNPLTCFQHAQDMSYTQCMQFCYELLDKCDILISCGTSKGTELERKFAIKSYVKVINYNGDLDELESYYNRFIDFKEGF